MSKSERVPLAQRFKNMRARVFILTAILLTGLLAAPEGELIKRNNYGIAYLEQFKFNEAADQFRKALEIKPDFVPAAVNLGIAHFYNQEYEKARAQFENALSLEPGQPQAHFYLGLLYKNQGEWDKAISHFERVRARDADDPYVNYNLGQTFLKKGDYEKAEELLRRVVELDPINAAARYNLATTLIRLGRSQEAQRELAEFQRLKSELKVSEVPGLQYGEQGKYSLAAGEFPELAAIYRQEAGGATEVRFVDVTDAAGINFQHAALVEEEHLAQPVGRGELERAKRSWICAMGSGAAFGDYNGDGLLDLYLVNCSPDGDAANALLKNNGNGTFSEVTQEAGVGYRGRGMGAVWGDYNNDGKLDLYITNQGRNVLYKNLGNGKFSDVTAEAKAAAGEKWTTTATFVDYDHDGDLDIFMAGFIDLNSQPAGEKLRFPESFRSQLPILLRNNGNGTFNEVTADARLAVSQAGASVAFTDFDNRRDVDLLVAGQTVRIFKNKRDGSFAAIPFQEAGFAVVPADYNKDDFTDLFIARREGGPLLMANRGGNFSADAGALSSVVLPQGQMGWGGAFLDYDNDGDLDLLVINAGWGEKTSSGQKLLLLENDGSGRFSDASAKTGIAAYSGRAYRGVALGDYDSDGDIDLLLTVNGGRPLLLRNDGGNRNRWLKLRLEGRNSNRVGIGAKVEVKANRLWQKIELLSGFGYLSQSPPEAIMGLGPHRAADVVRILWPSGVLQSEIDIAANRTEAINELDRRGTSCPLLYAWNGREFAFVTDFLGGCAIGYLTAPGSFNYPDTDEYIRVTGEQLVERDGYFSIKMNNQLEEVIMFDQVRLHVVDHPADIEVYPNERLMPGPPYPEHKLYAVKGSRPPVAAYDDKGNAIIDLIERADRRYPDSFKLLPFKGYAEKHAITLDLGDLSRAKRVLLLLTAWIDYADSTANFAAAQAGLSLIPPYLEVKDKLGRWVKAIDRMGFPAGLPKTMLVDLTGVFKSQSYQVRITTNMRIYWDQILVDTFEGDAPLRETIVYPSRALLRHAGYPREHSPDARRPLIYDYSVIDKFAPWKSHIGRYTRYGDVRELLLGRDDMYVITRHGDEIELDFPARALPSLPPGWRRTFLVYADGFGKDMDLLSAAPHTIEPLPFHGMSAYPYPEYERYPMDERRRRYWERYNTRELRENYQPLYTASNPGQSN